MKIHRRNLVPESAGFLPQPLKALAVKIWNSELGNRAKTGGAIFMRLLNLWNKFERIRVPLRKIKNKSGPEEYFRSEIVNLLTIAETIDFLIKFL